MRQVDDMLERVRGLGNANVVATLERARHALLRQKAGATQLDPAVLAAAREFRQQQDLELQRARARCTATRAARCGSDKPGKHSRTLLAMGETLRRARRAFTAQAACGESACRSQRARTQGL